MHDQTTVTHGRNRFAGRLGVLVGANLVASLGALFAPGRAAGAVLSVAPAEYSQRIVAPHRGKALAVNFWATWCEPCRQEMPDLISVGRKLSRSGLAVVLVSADFPNSRAAVERFLAGLASPFPSFLEESADPQTFIDAVDPKWGGELPHTAIYSRDGRLRMSLASKQTAAGFERAFREVLRQR